MRKELFGIKAPAKECSDKKCPFHGELNVKKEFFTGKVIKKDINHSATIEWFRSTYLHKYERYALERSRLRVHNPACINAEIGQEVLAAKTRPLSKTKHHVIIQIKNTEIKTSAPVVESAETKREQKKESQTEQKEASKSSRKKQTE